MADIWDDILTQHQAPGRHYHNVRHLCSMSSWLRAHQANFPCPATVFSVLWHDYVYDPTSTENEAKSAEAADEQLAQLNVDSNTRERVVSNIRATVKHEPEVRVLFSTAADEPCSGKRPRIACVTVKQRRTDVYRPVVKTLSRCVCVCVCVCVCYTG